MKVLTSATVTDDAVERFEAMKQILRVSDMMAKIDRDWLVALMIEENLQPRLLREAIEIAGQLDERLHHALHGKLWRLWQAWEDVLSVRYDLEDNFWLQVGLAVGALLQWQHDNLTTLEDMGLSRVNDLGPQDYLGAIAQATWWADREGRESGRFAGVSVVEWLRDRGIDVDDEWLRRDD